MQKTKIVVGFLCVIALVALLLCIKPEGSSTSLPAEMHSWFVETQTNLVQQIEVLSDKDFELAYKEAQEERATLLKKLGSKYECSVNTPTPKDFRSWLQTYVEKDFERFLAQVLACLSATDSENLRELMVKQPTPKLVISWSDFGNLGATDIHDNTIRLNPAALRPTYEAVRSTLSHELLHYYIEARGGRARDFLAEGVTEYINVKVSERLGWSTPQLGYEDEITTVGIVAPQFEKRLLAWYVSKTETKKLLNEILDWLVRSGVPKDTALQIATSWLAKDSEFYRASHAETSQLTEEVDLLIRSSDLSEKGDALERDVKTFKESVFQLQEICRCCAKDALPLSDANRKFIDEALSNTSGIQWDSATPPTSFCSPFYLELAPALKSVLLGTPKPKQMTKRQQELTDKFPSIRNSDDVLSLATFIDQVVDAERTSLMARNKDLIDQGEKLKLKGTEIVGRDNAELERLRAAAKAKPQHEVLISALKAAGCDYLADVMASTVPKQLRDRIVKASE